MKVFSKRKKVNKDKKILKFYPWAELIQHHAMQVREYRFRTSVIVWSNPQLKL